jgi:5-methylcytosine-specific restriction endonuclease McrBC GTP-binding regulatory subunit McrB
MRNYLDSLKKAKINSFEDFQKAKQQLHYRNAERLFDKIFNLSWNAHGLDVVAKQPAFTAPNVSQPDQKQKSH